METRFKVRIILGKFWLVLAILILLFTDAYAVRIKDIADIGGVRYNQLVGYGLIVGLDGTGDGKKSKFTIQSMVSMLEKMGITVNQKDVRVENVAAVMVTAKLPAFARVGGRIDANVSSIGDADALHGGTLIFTPLKAANGQIYAVAQGPVSTGGFSAQGLGGAVKKNFPTVGRVINGALIEREVPSNFNQKSTLSLTLHSPDFTTASRVAERINAVLYDHIAEAPDAGTIRVKVPGKYSANIVQFVSLIEGLSVTPDAISRVVINERTGTVVMGENVRISTVAIAHGNLSIEIRGSASVSQPLPFSGGETVAVPETEIVMKEEVSPIFLLESGASLGEVVRGLNALGVSPRDLIAIFQAIKAAGALQARLEII